MQYSQSEQDTSANMSGHPVPNDMLPESSDSFGMDSMTRQTQMNAFASYASLGGALNQYPSGFSFRALPMNGQGQQVLSQDPGRAPLEHFLIHDDQPWSSLRVNGVARSVGSKARQSNGYPIGIDMSAFTGFRSPAVLSEADDSGYYGSSASIARQSVVDASVYSGDPDCGTETQSFIGPMSDLHLQTHPSQSPGTAGKSRHGAGSEAGLICPVCHERVKTKAELNKHDLRHRKPFMCQVAGCARKEGFGTTNDRDRHMKSVHNLKGIKYRCHEGTCKGGTKLWPRADNFVAHLKRKHQITLGPTPDLSPYEQKPADDEDVPELAPSEVQKPRMTSHMSPSTWMDMDQPQDHSDLPSGEINLEPLRDCSQSAVAENLSMRNSSDSSRLRLDMDPMLSANRESRSNEDIILSAPTNGPLYPHETYKPDVVSPAELGSPPDSGSLPGSQGVVSAREYISVSPDRDAGQAQLVRPGTMDRTEFPADTDRDASEDGYFSDGASQAEDADEDNTAGDAFQDHQDSRATLESVSSAAFNATRPLVSGGKPATSELPSIKSLIRADLDETEASAFLESLEEHGILDKIISRFGYQKAKEEDQKTGEAQTDPAAPAGKVSKDVLCNECGKSFKRHCELKKHQKRHDKPYACTHTDCDKRFGSKNDWKRHENSQHIQLEFWRCNEKGKGGVESKPCGKTSHRRENFKHHLEKEHGITDPQTLERRCIDYRNGRNHESRFWCGFCQQTIEFTKRGSLVWSERFDHIDAHFTGKDGPRRDIREWKSIESEPLEIFQTIVPDARSPDSSDGDFFSTEEEGDAGTRKRRAENDDAATTKRRRLAQNYKSIQGLLLWECCTCESVYTRAVTTRCMNASCAHVCCESCQLALPDDMITKRPVD
ncbi:hypothetical protein QBC47DRAFT_220619 [Echria macrotheca]|uniref:C2H2-type domain-containing protein n=1 Tax=Echria macrotheca TaxID=438768 RepID=A0AAJ0BB25_9PEZI|nr:hypothetical protein QBC47DRAFT_220619 [Echria macrotheca]